MLRDILNTDRVKTKRVVVIDIKKDSQLTEVCKANNYTMIDNANKISELPGMIESGVDYVAIDEFDSMCIQLGVSNELVMAGIRKLVNESTGLTVIVVQFAKKSEGTIFTGGNI